MNPDVMFFENPAAIQSASQGFITTAPGRSTLAKQNAVFGSSSTASSLRSNYEAYAEKIRSTTDTAGITVLKRRAWSNNAERRYNDLLAKYASESAGPEDIQELVRLRKERRQALPPRTGLELIDEIRRHEATENLTSAFEAYVKVVRPARYEKF